MHTFMGRHCKYDEKFLNWDQNRSKSEQRHKRKRWAKLSWHTGVYNAIKEEIKGECTRWWWFCGCLISLFVRMLPNNCGSWWLGPGRVPFMAGPWATANLGTGCTHSPIRETVVPKIFHTPTTVVTQLVHIYSREKGLRVRANSLSGRWWPSPRVRQPVVQHRLATRLRPTGSGCYQLTYERTNPSVCLFVRVALLLHSAVPNQTVGSTRERIHEYKCGLVGIVRLLISGGQMMRRPQLAPAKLLSENNIWGRSFKGTTAIGNNLVTPNIAFAVSVSMFFGRSLLSDLLVSNRSFSKRFTSKYKSFFFVRFLPWKGRNQ